MNNPAFHSRRAFAYLGLLPCVGLALASSVSAAEDGSDAMQRGHHGPVTIADIQTRLDQRFNDIDLDDNEALTPEEFTAAESTRRGERTGRHHGKRRGWHERGGYDGDRQDSRDEDTKAAREAALFTAMDTDGNGELSATEASHENRRAARHELMQKERFSRLDSNGDGTVDRAEFSARIERLTAADTDGDGELTRDEMRAQRRS